MKKHTYDHEVLKLFYFDLLKRIRARIYGKDPLKLHIYEPESDTAPYIISDHKFCFTPDCLGHEIIVSYQEHDDLYDDNSNVIGEVIESFNVFDTRDDGIDKYFSIHLPNVDELIIETVLECYWTLMVEHYAAKPLAT